MTPLPISNYEDYKKYVNKSEDLQKVLLDEALLAWKYRKDISEKLGDLADKIDNLAITIKNLPVWEK